MLRHRRAITVDSITMMDDELRETLLWMAGALQRLEERAFPRLTIMCSTCNHGIEHHFDTPDDSEYGCLYPKTLGAPHKLCTCTVFTSSA